MTKQYATAKKNCAMVKGDTYIDYPRRGYSPHIDDRGEIYFMKDSEFKREIEELERDGAIWPTKK
jgi:hypothetical protein